MASAQPCVLKGSLSLSPSLSPGHEGRLRPPGIYPQVFCGISLTLSPASLLSVLRCSHEGTACVRILAYRGKRGRLNEELLAVAPDFESP